MTDHPTTSPDSTTSPDTPTSPGAHTAADGDISTSADVLAQNAPQTGSGSDAVETGEFHPPESASSAPQTADAEKAEEGGVPGEGDVAGGDDEDYLPPGQTEVPVGEEVLIDDDTMRRALEAILMVTDEPLPVLTLARAVGRPTGDISAALNTLAEEYTEQGRGFDLREVGGGWRYYTRVEAAPYVERFVLDGQQARLTQAALETLAVVAYKQPVSRARVSAIRGVNVDGVMRTLVARGLVEEAGADTESQATLYRTTTYFLERMGMQSLDDLPELAPYLPEMDDIEEELAAQTIPAASEQPATDQDAPEAAAGVPDQDSEHADPQTSDEPGHPDDDPATTASYDTEPAGGHESEDETDPGIDGDLDTADAEDPGIDGDLSSAGADEMDSGDVDAEASHGPGEADDEPGPTVSYDEDPTDASYDVDPADADQGESEDATDPGIDGDLDTADADDPAIDGDDVGGPSSGVAGVRRSDG